MKERNNIWDIVNTDEVDSSTENVNQELLYKPCERKRKMKEHHCK